MGQQQGVLAGTRNSAGVDWDAKSTKSACSLSSSKRFRRKLRKSLRIRKNRSCRDLSATFQYSLGDHDDCDQLNLNTATEDELMTLTGVSRQTARDIVAHRRAIGGFRKVEDLALVSGVGANKLELLRNEVCVSNFNHKRISRGQKTALSLESLDGTPARSSTQTQVNINTASMFELMALPGLTQELAAGICHVREKRGHFKTIDALLKVKGISSVQLAVLRPRLCVDFSSCPTPTDDNGSAASNDSTTFHTGSDIRPATSLCTRKSPSISLNSRRSRQIMAASLAPKSWDPEIDYDIYKLIAHLTVRPIVARNDPPSISHSRVRIALWDLEQLSEDKASNLGVQEVVCRTLLENEISVLVCHDVTSPFAAARLTTELNQPLLSRIAAWEPQERRWHYIFPTRALTSNGHDDKKPQNGYVSFPTVSKQQNSERLVESLSGLLYAAANGLRHLDHKLVDLGPNLAPALIAHFEVGASLQFSVVSVDLRGLSGPTGLRSALPSFVERLAAELGQTDNVVVCGNFLTSATDEALDELARVGFHLLHPIASRDHLLHEHLHVWCSPGARALCRSSEAETIQSGLMHPMIPKDFSQRTTAGVASVEYVLLDRSAWSDGND
ncbi:endonuclease/exonuclease/phosphatase family domain-containing protein 1-like isoform X2 [Varroa jacobsoni]|uniref:endonuclease/exonuclease/phosphatase family domain-containing protein 1-like isoform X2 n=1 Tax=Varroa jacobsoni TaxID=62625 RepID=UPI000BF8A3EA|nr:endonuclease/exonuclease/phosphatase family domain-containing protein 1-like isoform X2 [Varroa jacobsoni]